MDDQQTTTDNLRRELNDCRDKYAKDLERLSNTQVRITAALTALSEVEYGLVGGNLAGEPIEANVVADSLKRIRAALEGDATPAPDDAEGDSPKSLRGEFESLRSRGHERINDPRKSEAESS